MKTSKAIAVIFLLLFTSAFSTASASEQTMVNGAGTLTGGKWAFSLDLGLCLPEPMGVGIRFDRGLGNRVQLGISASTVILMSTVSINSVFNLFKTENDSDFLSFYLTPTFAQAFNILFKESDADARSIEMFYLQPGLSYEHRFGEQRNTGLYLKAGTFNAIASTSSGKLKFSGLTSNSTAIQGTVGLQHNFGGSFSITGEGSMLARVTSSSYSSNRFGGMGKIGLTWAF